MNLVFNTNKAYQSIAYVALAVARQFNQNFICTLLGDRFYELRYNVFTIKW